VTDRHARRALEELGAVEQELMVLAVAWSGSAADIQAGISLTCFRFAERLRSVRDALAGPTER